MSESQYFQLSKSDFNLKWFSISDEFEEEKRNLLISMINNNEIKAYEKKLKEKGR